MRKMTQELIKITTNSNFIRMRLQIEKSNIAFKVSAAFCHNYP